MRWNWQLSVNTSCKWIKSFIFIEIPKICSTFRTE
jgi:hypothetical protein